MGSLMYAQMGLRAFQGITNFAVAREQAKMDRVIQDYNNTMSALAAAQSQNTIRQNEIQARDASVRQGLGIQQALIAAEGAAEVSAGAAGVAGGSVQGVMRGLRASASQAQYARTEQTRLQMEAFGQERRNVNIAKATNKDVSVIPRASATSALLGIGTDMLKIWDSNQTPQDQLASRLGRTVGRTLNG